MPVKRIVPNVPAVSTAAAKGFYCDILGMEIVMDLGWIITFSTNALAPPQLSVAVEGGSGTVVPDVSIEVDNIDEVYKRVLAGGFAVEHGPVDEPWGVRRFFVRDPFGRLVNILSHDLAGGH
ncbi:MAG TPA: VOC family protein [Methylocella sp.]|nr:VOC family protein [Methylocella sp.]